MKQDILYFVEKFVERMKRQKRAFSLAELEREYAKSVKKQNKQPVKWDNMLRLTVVSKLLKKKEMQRTYQIRADGDTQAYFYIQ